MAGPNRGADGAVEEGLNQKNHLREFNKVHSELGISSDG